MNTVSITEMRSIDGGWHCKYCCQDMGFFTYLFHGVGNSLHMLNKKLKRKCKH